MAVTLGSTGITFPDATTQTTAATGGVTSLNGQTGAITDTNLYAIGSYVTGRPQNNNTDYQVNTTIAGSSLYTTPSASARDASSWVAPDGSTMSAGVALVNTGTWRCVSPALRATGLAYGLPGLWVRIS